MGEFIFRPSPNQWKAKLFFSGALLIAAVALVCNMLQWQPLLAQVVFLLAAVFACFVFVRYMAMEYIYSMSPDLIFDVRRKQGKRETVYCTVALSDILSAEVLPTKAIPKKCFFATKSMLPSEVYLLTMRIDDKESYLALEAEPAFVELFSALLSRHQMPYREMKPSIDAEDI